MVKNASGGSARLIAICKISFQAVLLRMIEWKKRTIGRLKEARAAIQNFGLGHPASVRALERLEAVGPPK